jgi:hypothetical protein
MKALENKHKGKPIFILGCGSSINEIDLTKLDSHITIGVNRIVYEYYPTYWMFIDSPITKEFGKKIPTRVIGSQILCWEHARYNKDGAYVFTQSRVRRAGKLHKDYNGLVFGNTTVFCAIHMAYIMGASAIVLCGVDLRYSDKQNHFYDKRESMSPFKRGQGGSRQKVKQVKPDGTVIWTRQEWIRMERNIHSAYLQLKGEKIPMYNTSMSSIIRDVPKLTLDDVLSKL